MEGIKLIIMSVEIITKEDLYQFRSELIQEIRILLKQTPSTIDKQWLKSAEVRKLLQISPGTLQNLRINGTLRYTKIGGSRYYSSKDIYQLLEGRNHG